MGPGLPCAQEALQLLRSLLPNPDYGKLVLRSRLTGVSLFEGSLFGLRAKLKGNTFSRVPSEKQSPHRPREIALAAKSEHPSEWEERELCHGCCLLFCCASRTTLALKSCSFRAEPAKVYLPATLIIQSDETCLFALRLIFCFVFSCMVLAFCLGLIFSHLPCFGTCHFLFVSYIADCLHPQCGTPPLRPPALPVPGVAVIGGCHTCITERELC